MTQGSLAGKLLAATPALAGSPHFGRTVVLIVEDEPAEGTLGVVLNRPTEIAVHSVLASWSDLISGPPVVFSGGPVSPSSALALGRVRGAGQPPGWRSLAGSPLMARVGLVDLGAGPGALAGEIDALRVFAGYAGWSAGQLAGEIEEGSWYVLGGDPADAFMAEPGRLWPAVLRRQGGDLALVATYPDDPAQN